MKLLTLLKNKIKQWWKDHLIDELDHTHHGMNAMMDDLNNYQVKTDRKIAELEKQLEIKTKQLERNQSKLKKNLPKEIRGVIGHIEFAQNNLR